jgi:nucleoside-diphosphate-sugar epimerase
LAEAAKAAGVGRFVYASSCSNYGSSDDGFIDEEAPFNPVTPYALSKVMSERNIRPLADATFSPIFLRAGTAYGISAKLRADLVVNNLTGYAFTTGHVTMKSDGMPWRPLVHIEDIAQAYLAVIEAPLERVHNQAFNVGATEENYRVRQVAELVAEIVPDATVSFATGAGPDLRNYRVNCDKIRNLVPGYRPRWTLRQGIEQLYRAYCEAGTTRAEFFGPRWMRVEHVKNLIGAGRFDGRSLRYIGEAA